MKKYVMTPIFATLLCLLLMFLSIFSGVRDCEWDTEVQYKVTIVALAGYGAHTGGKHDKLYDSNRMVVKYPNGALYDYQITFSQAVAYKVGDSLDLYMAPKDLGVPKPRWEDIHDILCFVLTMIFLILSFLCAGVGFDHGMFKEIE